MSSTFNVSYLVPFVAGEKDLRINPFQEEGNDEDMPMLPPSIKSEDEDDHAYKGPMTRSRTKTTSLFSNMILRFLGYHKMFVQEGKLLEVNCIEMRVPTKLESTSTIFQELSERLCASPCTPVEKSVY